MEKQAISKQAPCISYIVQDHRSGKQHIWYLGAVGTHGSSGLSTFAGGARVYKSVNNGRSWYLLRGEANENEIVNSAFVNRINSMAINPTNGDLYVATNNGIYRQKEDGNSFEKALEGGLDYWTEIAITSKGRLYATVGESDSINPNKGFFTSTDDGVNWQDITPENLPKNPIRTVMAVDPANENTVYFLIAIYSNTSVISGNDPAPSPVLLKYNAEVTTATSAISWTDLSDKIPFSPLFSQRKDNEMNLQGGFSALIKVHPNDSNIIFVGGSHLYRTTDGFTKPLDDTDWIGGYLDNTANDDGRRIYTNHHPNQKALVFYPSNPNKVLSANSGGVYVTENITSKNVKEPVDWTPLNNGYVTTLASTVSFDPSANSDDLLAGFSDNGTWLTTSTNPNTQWVQDLRGNGSFNAIADNGETRYVSFQKGNVFRIDANESNEFDSYTIASPLGVSKNANLAIHPFVLDTRNDNIMYYPIKNVLWRNNNLDKIKEIDGVKHAVDWTNIPGSETPENSKITALDVSKYPIANRLYYGTNNGGVYRLDTANLDGQKAIDLTTDKGLPSGYINDISVDPSNDSRVLVTFSNYGIPSLFLTTNAGETWTDISGNLEENPDGTGNGPSVLGAAFFGNGISTYGSKYQNVLVATSTGVYYTSRIRGKNTRWRREHYAIGNTPIQQLKTRKDGFIAVATTGKGVFSARFPLPLNLPIPEPKLSVENLLKDIEIVTNDKNSQNDFQIDISEVFNHSEGQSIAIELVNTNTNLINATIEGEILKVSRKTNDIIRVDTTIAINLIATSGEEQVAEGFVISLIEKPIYEQIDPIDESVKRITNLGYPSAFYAKQNYVDQPVDDFTVPEGTTWTIDRVLALGVAHETVAIEKVTVVIFKDDNGRPGEEIYTSGKISTISDKKDPNVNVVLTNKAVLESGNYWFSVYVDLPYYFDSLTGMLNLWIWTDQERVTGGSALARGIDEGVLEEWLPTTTLFTNEIRNKDMRFRIFGSSENNSTTVKSERIEKQVTVSPNPSSGIFSFHFNTIKSKDTSSITIYNVLGSEVFSSATIDSESKVTWDASTMASGFYFAEIVQGDKKQVIKLSKE